MGGDFLPGLVGAIACGGLAAVAYFISQLLLPSQAVDANKLGHERHLMSLEGSPTASSLLEPEPSALAWPGQGVVSSFVWARKRQPERAICPVLC